MTSSSPTPALDLTTPPRGGGTPVGELDPIAWHLATCHRCDLDYAEPFRYEGERNAWAAAHVTGAGHTVHLCADSARPLEHSTALVRCEERSGGGYRWLCTEHGCERWNGPFVSAQLAIASWVSHRDAVR
jgi:hypothetical protein